MNGSRWREPSLDELARIPQEEVVRQRFDARNVDWSMFLLISFCIVTVPWAIAAFAEPLPVPVRILVPVELAFVAVSLRAVRRVRRAMRSGGEAPPGFPRFVESRPTPFVILLVLGSLAIACAAASNPGAIVALGTVLPFAVAGIRIVPARRLAIHAACLTIPILASELRTFEEPLTRGAYVGILAANVAAFFAGAVGSRRMRREIVSRFAERRTAALEQLRMRDELLYARRVQESLLPAAPPKVPGLDIGALSLPATEVGGDYWDCVPVGGKVAFVSADVAGHGLASGIVLASLRAGVRLLRDTLANPEELLRRLHGLLAESSGQRLLVTAAIAVLDPSTGELRVANAGHPPLLILRSDGSVAWIDLPAAPLGVRLPFEPATAVLRLEVGELLLLHSDGAYEAFDPAEEAYGLDRLAAFAAERREVAAQELCRALAADVARWRGTGAQLDDLTLVAVRRT